MRLRTLSRPALALAALTLSAGCASTPKRLEYGRLKSAVMKKDMEYAVYKPPQYSASERLPLVVFLHGGGDDPDAFDKAGLGQRLDRAMTAHRVPRAIIVLPEGDLGFWENWANGKRKYRDWVIRELMPYVQRHYHTEPCPQGCHVMGVSMGGYGALRFAFLEPGLFSTATAISAPIMDTEHMLDFSRSFWLRLFIPTKKIWGRPSRAQIEKQDLFLRWTSQRDLKGVRLMLSWGNDDRGRIQTSSAKFHQHLASHGIEHVSFVYDGGHNWKSWSPVIERALRIQLREAGAEKAPAPARSQD